MPTPANAMAASATAGYDIPQRLKTLHNLVCLSFLFNLSYLKFLRLSLMRHKDATKLLFPYVSKHWKIWKRTMDMTIRMSLRIF